MTADHHFVRFEDVTKSYDGRTRVVKGVNLDVPKGEFLTMLGPSGSGKTTCLLMLAGFQSITSGEIHVDGKSVSRIPPHKRGIGVVFQSYALFPHMTVAQNIAYPLEVRRLPRPEIARRVGAVLEMMRLSGFDDRRPAQLSGGQRQRVAVARALVFDPGLVLMDEPLGALDKQLRDQMQYEIKRIHEQLGITTIYVTHDQTEALTMSDRIAVFNDGVIQQCASPTEIYERPGNAFVASFIGENNQIPGTVRQMSGELCAVEVEGLGTVSATPVQVSGVGERVGLSIRPERIQVNPEPGALPGRWPATVEGVTYIGDHLRAHLRLGERHTIVVKVQPEQAASLSKGETVTIGWPAPHCRAFPVSG